jgi:hypothetical protein
MALRLHSCCRVVNQVMPQVVLERNRQAGLVLWPKREDARRRCVHAYSHNSGKCARQCLGWGTGRGDCDVSAARARVTRCGHPVEGGYFRSDFQYPCRPGNGCANRLHDHCLGRWRLGFGAIQPDHSGALRCRYSAAERYAPNQGGSTHSAVTPSLVLGVKGRLRRLPQNEFQLTLKGR